MTSETNAGLSSRKCLALIVLAGLAAYFNSFAGAFVFDDGHAIIENRALGRLLGDKMASTRPTISVSLTLNYWLDGRNVRGYHFFNLAVHILAGLTLFGIVRRTLLLERFGGRFQRTATGLALAVSLLWLVHPLQTQAVTYIIQRCESLMGLFYLLTLYCVLRGATSSTPLRWYAGAVLSLALGGGCKEVILTAPVVILLYDWTFLAGSCRELLRQRGALYAAFLVPTLAVLGLILASGALVDPQGAVGLRIATATPLTYALTQPGVILHYLRLTFWPHPLCLDYYGWPVVKGLADCWLPLLVVAGLAAVTLWGVCRRTWWGFLGAWFFLILAPTSTIMPLQDVAFEHRMYLSLAAVAVFVVLGVAALLRLAEEKGLLSPRAQGILGPALLAGLVVLLTGVTVRRNEDYRTAAIMWADAAAKRPTNPRARGNLAMVQMHSGDPEAALETINEALLLDPTYWINWGYQGQILRELGRLPEAEKTFAAVVRLRPREPRWQYELGLTQLFAHKDREALVHLREAVQLDPERAIYHAMLANCLEETGQPDEAAAEYRAALRSDRQLPRALDKAARGLAFQEDVTAVKLRSAQLTARAATRMTEDRSPQLLDTLAIVYARLGRFKEAAVAGQQAAALADQAGNTYLAGLLRERVRLYQQGRPYRQDTSHT